MSDGASCREEQSTIKEERGRGGATFHRAVSEDFSDKVNIKVRSDDRKGVKQGDSWGRAFQAAAEAEKRACCIEEKQRSLWLEHSEGEKKRLETPPQVVLWAIAEALPLLPR